MRTGPWIWRTGAIWLGDISLQSNGAGPRSVGFGIGVFKVFDAGKNSLRRAWHHLLCIIRSKMSLIFSLHERRSCKKRCSMMGSGGSFGPWFSKGIIQKSLGYFGVGVELIHCDFLEIRTTPRPRVGSTRRLAWRADGKARGNLFTGIGDRTFCVGDKQNRECAASAMHSRFYFSFCFYKFRASDTLRDDVECVK